VRPQGAISTAAELVERCRKAGVVVFHLAAAYRPDLSDVPPLVLARQQAMKSCLASTSGGTSSSNGALGLPMLGDDALLPAVTPAKVGTVCSCHPLTAMKQAKEWSMCAAPQGDRVLNRPGFYNSALHDELAAFGVSHLLICGLAGSVSTQLCRMSATSRRHQGSLTSPTLDRGLWRRRCARLSTGATHAVSLRMRWRPQMRAQGRHSGCCPVAAEPLV